MSMWFTYTRAGQEFDLQDEMRALGLWAVAPRKVELVRQGKRRRPDTVVSPYLPGYLFFQADDDQWHQIRAKRLVRSTMGMTEASARDAMRFIARVEADYTARMAEIEAGIRVAEYNPGDLLQIMCGPLAGHIAAFVAMQEGSDFPRIRAEVALFGTSVPVTLDPISAKRAAQ